MKSALGPALLLALLGSGCGPAVRAVDTPARAFWILSNLGDAKVLPQGANVCMEPFCRRTDTVKKYVGGRKGYTSQVHYRYCPEHEPAFVRTGSRLDGFFYFCYWILTVLVSLAAICVVIGIPIYGVAEIWGRLRGPGHAPDPDTLASTTAIAGMIVTAIAWLLFVIW